MLSIKYSIGSASNLILIPGTVKLIARYTAINITMNRTIGTVFFFTLTISINSYFITSRFAGLFHKSLSF